MFEPADLEADIKQAMKEIESFEEKLPGLLEGEVPGIRVLGQQERRNFLMQKLQEWPPEQFVNQETGETITISPWVLAMQIAEGGQDVLDEIEQAFMPPKETVT